MYININNNNKWSNTLTHHLFTCAKTLEVANTHLASHLAEL